MHLIISAKAGTDVAVLTNAARAFLHDDHKFMFGVHTDKESAGHIHAHASHYREERIRPEDPSQSGYVRGMARGVCATRSGTRLEDRRDHGEGAGFLAKLRPEG
jgi:hypothetical protein